MKNRVHKMNCLDWKHPFLSIKWAYWRIIKGYCPYDVWDWNGYMAQLIHDSLMCLIKDGYNGALDSEKIAQIADSILDATDFQDYYNNPFREDYYNDLINVQYTRCNGKSGLSFNGTDKALSKHFWFVQNKNYERALKNIKEAFEWLAENWFKLLD